jgi:hypothetical protein
MIHTSKVLKNSLWEYDYQKLNYSDEIVILRALNFWEVEDIQNIEHHIWKEKIIDVFQRNLNQIDGKSKNFWKIYFHIEILNDNKSMYDKLNTPTFTRSFG